MSPSPSRVRKDCSRTNELHKLNFICRSTSTVAIATAHSSTVPVASSTTLVKASKPHTQTVVVSKPPPTTSPKAGPKPTTTHAAPSQAPAPPPTINSPDGNAYLQAHNSFRAQHGASPLVWDSNLASKASQWSSACVFKHSGGSLGPYGGSQ